MRVPASILLVAIAGVLAQESAPAAQERPLRTIKEGVLDEIKLSTEKLPAATH